MTQSSRAVPETGVDSGVASASVRPEPIDVAAWRKAMEGVTPGPWSAGASHVGASVVDADDAMERVCRIEVWSPEQDTLDAAWIARCSPAGISTLLDALEAKDRELSAICAVVDNDVRLMDPPDGGDPTTAEKVANLRRMFEAAEQSLAKTKEAGKELYKWTLVIESAMHHDAPRDHPKVMAAIKQLFSVLENSKAALADANSNQSTQNIGKNVSEDGQPVSGSREQRGNEEG